VDETDLSSSVMKCTCSPDEHFFNLPAGMNCKTFEAADMASKRAEICVDGTASDCVDGYGYYDENEAYSIVDCSSNAGTRSSNLGMAGG
jgi:hypothetical protein